MRGRYVSLLIALSITLLDQLTKMWVKSAIPLYSSRVVIPGFFSLVHIKNRGIAFGLFNSSPLMGTWILTAFSMLASGFILYLLWREGEKNGLFSFSLAMVLGGAVGNLIDRLLWGEVTDFLYFYIGPYHWPAFNVADTAISVGGMLMAFSLLRKGHR